MLHMYILYMYIDTHKFNHCAPNQGRTQRWELDRCFSETTKASNAQQAPLNRNTNLPMLKHNSRSNLGGGWDKLRG